MAGDVLKRLRKTKGRQAEVLEALESRLLLSNTAPTEKVSALLAAPAHQTSALTISYGDIFTASGAADLDGDTLSFLITNVPPIHGSLSITHLGVTSTVVAGSTFVVTGDTLTWTPTAVTLGKIQAFSVQAFDGTVFSAHATGIYALTSALPVVSITAPATSAWESAAGTNAHRGLIQIRRSGNLSQPLSVAIVISGTAVLGTHYTLLGPDGVTPINTTTTVVTIPAGKATANLTIAPIQDGIADPVLSMIVTVQADPNTASPAYARAATTAATVTILDSNPAFTITAATGGITEGKTNQLAFTVTRTAPPGGTLAVTSLVTLNFTGGSFDVANHLSLFPTTLTFLPGQTSRTITISTTDNGSANGPQTIIGRISGTNVAVTGTGTATLNVIDASATVTIVPIVATATEIGTRGEFLVQRTGSIAAPLTVNFTTSGSAIRGTHYLLQVNGVVLTGSTFTIPAGRSAIDVFLIPFDDHMNDTLSATISLAAGGASYNLGGTTSTAVAITNIARPPTIRITTVPRLASLNGSFTLTYADLVLLTGAAKARGNNNGTLLLTVNTVSFGTIQVIPSGTTTPVAADAGTIIHPGDALVWTAPLKTKASRQTAFTLEATDGTVSSVLASNIVVTIL